MKEINVFRLLPENYRNFVFFGGAGSGKTEIVLNLARLLGNEEATDVFDLDQTKPLFRCRDAVGELGHITLHYSEQLLDAPVQVGGMEASFADSKRYTLVDAGGNDIGARMLGQYIHLLERSDTMIYYVVNPYRCWSDELDAIDRTMSSVLGAAQIRSLDKVSVICNPTLGETTTYEEWKKGKYLMTSLLRPYVALAFTCISQKLWKWSEEHEPLLPIRRFMAVPWG